MPYTITDLLTGSLKEIRIARAGDVPSPDELSDMLQLFNELLDEWNSDTRAVYNTDFADFTLVPNLSPHTIGPAGSGPANTNPTFVVAFRPVSLVGAQLNLGGTPGVYVRLWVRDDAWYRRQPLPGLTQTVPTDVYYSPDWNDPNNTGSGYGSLYFFGVPQTAYGVRLWTKHQLSQIADPTLNLSVPQGWRAALRLTLAERAAPSFGQQLSMATTESARLARERIFGNDDEACSIATADAGLGRSEQRSAFNYANRSFT